MNLLDLTQLNRGVHLCMQAFQCHFKFVSCIEDDVSKNDIGINAVSVEHCKNIGR